MRRLDPWIVALIAAVTIYYCATPGIFQGKASGDGYLAFLYLDGIVFHRSIDLALNAPDMIEVLGRTSTGHVANRVPIGVVAFFLPFYLLSLLLRAILRVPAGDGRFDYFVTGLATLFFAALGVRALFALLRRRFDLGSARVASIAIVAATPLCWYIVTQPLYQHAIAFFVVAALLERWDRVRDEADGRDAALLGLLAGLAMTVRVQDAIWGLLIGGDFLLRRRRLAIPYALAAAVVFAPQLLVWRWQYGTYQPIIAEGYMRWSEPAIVETLFSTRAGLFPWAPILMLACAGLFFARRRAPHLAAIAAVGLLLQLYVNACVWDWHGSYGYGARRFTGASAAFAIGLAGIYAAADRLRPVLSLAMAVATMGNAIAMEAMRTMRAPSSASSARRLHSPFVHPAALGWAILHRTTPSRFEEVVGNYLIDRDFAVRAALLHPPELSLDRESPYRIDGEGAVRVLVPAQSREPFRFAVEGVFPPGPPIALTWNGVEVPIVRSPFALYGRIEAASVRTHAATNELVIRGLASGAELRRLRATP